MTTSPLRASRWPAGISLLLFSATVFGYLWWGKFHYYHRGLLWAAYALSLIMVGGNHWYYRDSLRRLGLRLGDFGQVLRWHGGFTLLGGLAVLGAGAWFGEFRLDRWSDVYVYLGWAGVQQYLLQNFLRARSEDLLGSPSRCGLDQNSAGGGQPRRASTMHGECAFPKRSWRPAIAPSLMAALLFASYHLPNPPLAIASFVGATAWCLLFWKTPSLFGAWISQSVLTTLLMLFFKHGALNQFEVGRAGYRFDLYGSGVKVAAGYDRNGAPLVATLPGPDRGVLAEVRRFTADGRLLAKWIAFPEFGFSGEIAVGDLGFGPGDEIAVTPGPGRENPPIIRVFDDAGVLLRELRPLGLSNGYGASVAIHRRLLYVSPGPGPSAPQTVLVLRANGQQIGTYSFSQLGLVNGIRAIGYGGAGSSELPEGLLLWGSPISVNSSRVYVYRLSDRSLRSVETIGTTFGANLTLLAVAQRGPGFAVAAGPLCGYPPLVGLFTLEGTRVEQFVAPDASSACGANVAAVDLDGDGREELVIGEGVGPARPALVRICRQDGKQIGRWQAYRD